MNSLILPNLKLHPEDLELFEEEPDEFINCFFE